MRAGWVSTHLLPPPSELVTTLADLAGNGTLIGHIGVSSLRVLIGFCIGAGLAVAVGAAVGLSRRTEALLDPTFQALRAQKPGRTAEIPVSSRKQSRATG